MSEAIIGLVVLAGGIIAAFFAGKRKERTDNETDTHNEYIATKARIDAAIRPDLSGADVDDSLRNHAKR
tara:strand:- start:325 stop:531 length:207 start_codon:yes stop_codon:yes gene_type:complete